MPRSNKRKGKMTRHDAILQLAPTPLISYQWLVAVLPPDWRRHYTLDFTEVNNYTTTEYDRVIMTFPETCKKSFDFCSTRIRVENVFSWLMYQLKKIEINELNHGNCEEMELFHGIRALDRDSIGIFTDTFDWRRFGTNTGNKFGCGTSFSPFASYASHYTEEYATFSEGVNIIISVKVLIAKSHIGIKNTIVPQTGYDTTRNTDTTVIVKYDDYTMYPEYIILYSGNIPKHFETERLMSQGKSKIPSFHSNCSHVLKCKAYLMDMPKQKMENANRNNRPQRSSQSRNTPSRPQTTLNYHHQRYIPRQTNTQGNACSNSYEQNKPSYYNPYPSESHKPKKAGWAAAILKVLAISGVGYLLYRYFSSPKSIIPIKSIPKHVPSDLQVWEAMGDILIQINN